MDIADMAEDRIEALSEEGLRRALGSVRQRGTEECVDCGDEIETARLAALPSARRCLCCQECAERFGGVA